MSTGKFHDFYLAYVKYTDPKKVEKDARRQAEAILQTCSELINKDGSKSVGIIYSANYGQTRMIERVYFAGGYNTGTNGDAQATVMCEMEALLGSTYNSLQGKMHILPITTLNANVQPWNENIHLGIVRTDLDRIDNYLQDGWDVLGWQNQDNNSGKDPKNPYAIGGKNAKPPNFPKLVSDKIQSTLIDFAKKYPGKPIKVKE